MITRNLNLCVLDGSSCSDIVFEGCQVSFDHVVTNLISHNKPCITCMNPKDNHKVNPKSRDSREVHFRF